MIATLTGEMLEHCLNDAAGRLNSECYPAGLDRKDLAVYCWPQRWPNSACGFGGVAMQAFWVAPTIVVSGPHDDVCVYHKGRLARHVKAPSEAFHAACGHMSLPGATDKAWENMERLPAPSPPPAETTR